MNTDKNPIFNNPTTLEEVIANVLWANRYEGGISSIDQIVFEFADWYHNGLSNVERGTPEEMFPKYIEIKRVTG